MPNIMITEKCNLKCPYCFAQNLMSGADMGMEEFEEALDFCLTNGNDRVGIIGGEPTLHPQFREMLERIIFNERVRNAVIFTNGIYIIKYIRQISNDKFSILFNCNSPKDIGPEAFRKMSENIDVLVREHYLKQRITIGINIYKTDYDFSYILELLQRNSFDRIRVSVSVPDWEARKTDSIRYYKRFENCIMNFFKALDDIGVLPIYDCNIVPTCVLKEANRDFIQNLVNKYERPDSNIYGENVGCQPVIDILPNLKSIRCFGLSDYLQVPIRNFRDISELRSFFINSIDAYAFNTTASPDCIDCRKRKNMRCSGGCLAFKANEIKEVSEYSENLLLNCKRG